MQNVLQMLPLSLPEKKRNKMWTTVPGCLWEFEDHLCLTYQDVLHTVHDKHMYLHTHDYHTATHSQQCKLMQGTFPY